MLNESRSFLQQDVFCSVIGGAMTAWAGLLCLFAVTGPAVASQNKAVLSLDSPWSTIFEGDSVTLTCDVPDPAEAMYTWYRGSMRLATQRGKNKYHLQEAKRSHSGAYSCEVPNSDRSDPLLLTVSYDWVILQAPYSEVFEGDSLSLRCLGWPTYSVSNVRFYKNGKRIEGSRHQQILSIPQVTAAGDSGKYTCEMKISAVIPPNHQSDELHLFVRELFGPPVLEVKPSAWAVEGALVSLKCKAELAPQRRDTKLRYSFYKGPRALVERSDSPEYSIKEMQFDNSGDYFCQVQTEKLTVQKRSSPLKIHVQQLFTLPLLEVKPSTFPVEGSPVSLTCKTELMVQTPDPQLRFTFYKGLRTSLGKTDSPEYLIGAVELADSGEYHCRAETVTESVRKESPQLRLHVARIPVSGISLEAQPAGGLVNEGGSLLVTCSVAGGTGPVTISLCRADPGGCEDRPASSSSRREEFVVAVTEEHSGSRYYCKASNDEQTPPIESDSLQISVKLRVSQPVLRFGTDGHRAVVGDTLVMTCESLKGSFPLRYQFYHGQRVLGSSEVNQTGLGTLRVTEVSEADAGLYSCDARNDVPDGIQRSEAVNLSVLVPVSGATLSFDKKRPEIWAGENLTLTCAVAAGTSPTFHWLHNGKEANWSAERYSTNAEGNVLHVGSVQPSHGGGYQCWATNQLNAERSFSASSEILKVTVLEVSNILPTMGLIFSLLCLIILLAVLLFLYLKHQQKADEHHFTPPASPTRIPQQRESDQRRTFAAQREEEEEEEEEENHEQKYSNVGITEPSQAEDGLLYAVIDHKELRTAAACRDSNDYFVTYAKLNDVNPAGAPPPGTCASSSNIYENF
ncbi:Fc receptor-like protein 3 isoform X2 [Rhinatrema bivittatum]|uniref:Fc receptor-like protein 3 isoform X2 n=1 Tax=Rhinatrema bivittatum TaxID=194408 RepID=UPI0011291080|nr:Fc receptor-like protein 3 isoform X2 [Rhinatrema bivittatum]